MKTETKRFHIFTEKRLVKAYSKSPFPPYHIPKQIIHLIYKLIFK